MKLLNDGTQVVVVLDRDGVAMAGWLAERVCPGSIVLLHDAIHRAQQGATVDRSQTLIAVDRLLGQLRDEIRFITVPELLRRGTPQRVNWYRGAGPGSA